MTCTFFGTPANRAVGVVNVNDAPTLTAPLTNQSIKQNDAFRYPCPELLLLM